MNPADAWIAAHGADLVTWRRRIHMHPELARQEFETTKFVAETLTAAGLSPVVLPSGSGVICDIGPGGPRVALRADMDALPLTEFTGAEYSSTVPACPMRADTTPTRRFCWRPGWRWPHSTRCRTASG